MSEPLYRLVGHDENTITIKDPVKRFPVVIPRAQIASASLGAGVSTVTTTGGTTYRIGHSFLGRRRGEVHAALGG